MSIHNVYSKLTSDEVEAVDDAWRIVSDTFTRWGFKAAFDDRAERLVEALAVYLKDSNPDLDMTI